MPELIMVCGPNGAGKSTLSHAISSRQNILCLDTDALTANGLSPIAAGKASAALAKDMVKKKISFIRESTLTANFDFQLMKEAKEYGFAIMLVYIRLASPEIALNRVLARVQKGGHDVPAEDVVRRFHRSLANLPKAIALADSHIILDNTGKSYALVTEG